MKPNKNPPNSELIEFSIGNYKFMCGFLHETDWSGRVIRESKNYCLWIWNGHYYGLASQNLEGEAAARNLAAEKGGKLLLQAN